MKTTHHGLHCAAAGPGVNSQQVRTTAEVVAEQDPCVAPVQSQYDCRPTRWACLLYSRGSTAAVDAIVTRMLRPRLQDRLRRRGTNNSEVYYQNVAMLLADLWARSWMSLVKQTLPNDSTGEDKRGHTATKLRRHRLTCRPRYIVCGLTKTVLHVVGASDASPGAQPATTDAADM